MNNRMWMISNEDIAQLKTFYAVETDNELISIQQRHIEKLQAMLKRYYPGELVRTSAREG